VSDIPATPGYVSSWTDLALAGGGRSLIEASAGTGKTWTISLLYLRLLLEEKFRPAQIIVTTFTDAAAQELRERIRTRLVWAQRQAESAIARNAAPGAHAPDDRRWLHARWRNGGDGVLIPANARADMNRLRLAQSELDRAPIGTLHSLCRRILADHPFESGSAFELGDPVTPDAINAELTDDLWRELSQSMAPLGEDDEIWRKAGRAKLEKYLRIVLAPGVGVATIEPAPIEEVMHEENARMLLAWLEVAQFTRTSSKLRTRLIALAQFIADGDRKAALPSDLDAVLAEPLANHLKPPTIASNATARVIAFARLANTMLSKIADLPRARALARYREELRARCRERLAASGRMTFDELIERVNRGLAGANGSVLADRLFAVWPVALVDEFQDTDMQQYAILDRIYRDRDRHGPSRPSLASGALGLLPGERGRLVMIGDPKQAIYRFRGGDIDAYLDARTTAGSTLALATNFRSSRQFVRAVNAFFAGAGATLSSTAGHAIEYLAVNDSDTRDAAPYCIDGMICERPLCFHYWEGGAVPDANDARVEAALEACANHVVELLSGRHTIGTRAVQPGDIAVLLPTRAQVTQLRAALRERNVPCVSSAWTSVFDSPWARELRIFLYAALHPRDEGAVRAALATRLGGRTFVDLRDQRTTVDTGQEPECRGDHGRPGAAGWQRDIAAFERYERQWRTRGVLALVQTLAGAAATRLFAGEDGERALTDLRHLGELLQARSEEIAGREELLSWFADECERAVPEAAEAAADERQQRIESDAARVRLMTLHGSKGLEFDIVLLPLMWANRHNWLDDIAIVHDAATQQRVVTFGADAMRRYQQEGQDERFRLFYVALTRARYACHVYALSPERSYSSRKPDTDPERAPLDCLVERLLRGRSSPPALDHVQWSSGRWSWPHDTYRPTRASLRTAVHVLNAPPSLPFESTWSFSALLRGSVAVAVEEGAAADEVAERAEEIGDEEAIAAMIDPAAFSAMTEPEHPQLAWLARIAGADFGNAVHAIFEHRVPGQTLGAQHALVHRCLLGEGVGLRGIALEELVPHLAERLQRTLDTPLLPPRGPSFGSPRSVPTLTLGALPAAAMCVEMPFEFALGEVSLRRLRAVCAFVPPTPLRTLRGLMSGKIDLLFEHGGRFHVLDYKSNRLGTGTRLSDYAAPQLERAMAADHYRFQALLYTVAVDRYLRQRMADYRPDAHLGEAIYLFVRAVGIAPDSAPNAGIWTQRFDPGLIAAVDAVLTGETRDAA
jgi:exodeoxyribonuclease V beta subunit